MVSDNDNRRLILKAPIVNLQGSAWKMVLQVKCAAARPSPL